jgi:hypothetical protein
MNNLQQHSVPGNTTSWADISPTIRARLERYGIVTFADWRALGRKRSQIFGVTRSMAAQIDALTRRAT